MKKAYIALSFSDRKELTNEVTAISEILQEKDYTSIVFVNDFSLDAESSDTEMMDAACSKIRDADVLIAELSHKVIGVGLEVGYAKALGKKIVYLRKKNASYSKTVGGVSDEIIIYKSISDLKSKLANVL